MDAAAARGHLQVLQFLHNIELASQLKREQGEDLPRRSYPHCTPAAMEAAAEAGHLDIIKWL